MQRMYDTGTSMVRRLPYSSRFIAAVWSRLPAPIRRLVRRTRHRMWMRSPSSMLSRTITPGIENRLLRDPDVVERLLNTDRAAELLSHQPTSSGKNVDWVAQVALNDPAGVVGALADLAERDPFVDAAVDRLVAGRAAALTEEQVVDVFLGLAEFERRQYWTNSRIRDAFLDFLCGERNVAETRRLLGQKLDVFEHTTRLRVVLGEGDSSKPIISATDQLDTSIEPPVAADILLSLDVDQMSELWRIEAFRTSFVENLLGDEDLFRLRSLLRSARFEDPTVRQALFDVLAGTQDLQLMTSHDEIVLLPSADLGFAKAYWADRDNQLSNLDRFVTARRSVGRRDGACFVDVGANLATHTIHALSSGAFGSGVAVEPDPRLLPILKANLALNEMDDRVSVMEFAASASDGVASFWSSAVNWGDNRLSPATGEEEEQEQKRVEEWSEIKVSVRSVDQILATAGVDPSDVGALWIDVQGHEAEVLRGASRTIAAGCDVVVEFWPAVLSREGRLDATMATFQSLSERWMDLDTGEILDHTALDTMRWVGIEMGESFYTDLALVNGITGQRP